MPELSTPARVVVESPRKLYRDEIVFWCDVRTGDLVLLEGTLIIAERVNVYTDTNRWDGHQWLRVDVDYHDEEGHRFSHAVSGWAWTAVRRSTVER